MNRNLDTSVCRAAQPCVRAHRRLSVSSRHRRLLILAPLLNIQPTRNLTCHKLGYNPQEISHDSIMLNLALIPAVTEPPNLYEIKYSCPRLTR